LVKLGLARYFVVTRYFVVNGGGRLISSPDYPGSIFRRRPSLFHSDIFARGFIGGTNARVLFRNRGITASPTSEEEEEPDGPSLAPRLGAHHGGQPYAGSDENHSGDSQSPRHTCTPCGGSHINGQKIPSSRLTLNMGAPQHLVGSGDVFQHLRHSKRVAIGSLPGQIG
jgi:hypothetical protein